MLIDYVAIQSYRKYGKMHKTWHQLLEESAAWTSTDKDQQGKMNEEE